MAVLVRLLAAAQLQATALAASFPKSAAVATAAVAAEVALVAATAVTVA